MVEGKSFSINMLPTSTASTRIFEEYKNGAASSPLREAERDITISLYMVEWSRRVNVPHYIKKLGLDHTLDHPRLLVGAGIVILAARQDADRHVEGFAG